LGCGNPGVSKTESMPAAVLPEPNRDGSGAYIPQPTPSRLLSISKRRHTPVNGYHQEQK
jgi:hypothetical protein